MGRPSGTSDNAADAYPTLKRWANIACAYGAKTVALYATLRSRRNRPVGLFRPFGAFLISPEHPPLAPWAAFFCRYAAGCVIRVELGRPSGVSHDRAEAYPALG